MKIERLDSPKSLTLGELKVGDTFQFNDSKGYVCIVIPRPATTATSTGAADVFYVAIDSGTGAPQVGNSGDKSRAVTKLDVSLTAAPAKAA
jgi:hypothetical protein